MTVTVTAAGWRIWKESSSDGAQKKVWLRLEMSSERSELHADSVVSLKFEV